jgi:hypothetical protein
VDKIIRACSRNGEKRTVHRVLVGKPEGNTLLGIPGRRWYSIKMYHREIEWT